MARQLKISIKWKIFGLVASLISIAVIIVIFRTNQIFRSDKEAFVKELSAKLASSTAKSLLNRINTLQDKLVIFISSKESLANTGARFEDQLQVLFGRYEEFLSIGFLTVNAERQFQLDWALRNPSGPAGQWLPDFEKQTLQGLDFRSNLDGRGLWRIKAIDGQTLYALGFEVKIVDVKKKKAQKNSDSQKPDSESLVSAWIVGILPSNAFDSVLNDFSTGLNTGFIADDQGIVIAHSDVSQRGQNFKTHSMVSDALQRTRVAGAGDYKAPNEEAVVGSFEWIQKSNLFVAVTTPRNKAFEAANVLMRNISYIGLVILLVAIGTAVLLSNYMTGPLQRLKQIAAEIGAGNFNVAVDVKTNDEIGELATSFAKMEQDLISRDEALASAQTALVQSEKMSAFGQLSAGIAHEVKNPLAGILGHAQLAMGQAQSDDIRKHLEVIEKETRRCKTIVENLMKFARAEKTELKPTDLAQVAQDTINLVEHQLTLTGVKIYKDFQPCPMVAANANHLTQVLLNLMVNAGHAMETNPTKNLTVRVVQAGNKAQIQIEDTGVGIPPEIQKKIFEPFFTTKPAGKGTGLGLSVSIGIVKDHKGDIYVKSTMGKGTTFFIDIPIPEGAQISTKPLENTHGGQLATKPGAAASAVSAVTATQATPAPAAPAPAGPTTVVAEIKTPGGSKAEPLKPKTEISKAEPAKVEGAKTDTKVTGISLGIGKKFETKSNGTPTPAPAAVKPAPAAVENLDDFKMKEPSTEPRVQKLVEPVLGGKTPLSDTSGLPMPPQEAQEPTEAASSEFKVKIRRPKLNKG
ncbi:MAG: HAMP domain-containing protein [Oligoflexia bacterium]|nr:HAMP domain-containing protein [Oligoflexia bacterium]